MRSTTTPIKVEHLAWSRVRCICYIIITVLLTRERTRYFGYKLQWELLIGIVPRSALGVMDDLVVAFQQQLTSYFRVSSVSVRVQVRGCCCFLLCEDMVCGADKINYFAIASLAQTSRSDPKCHQSLYQRLRFPFRAGKEKEGKKSSSLGKTPIIPLKFEELNHSQLNF